MFKYSICFLMIILASGQIFANSTVQTKTGVGEAVPSFCRQTADPTQVVAAPSDEETYNNILSSIKTEDAQNRLVTLIHKIIKGKAQRFSQIPKNAHLAHYDWDDIAQEVALYIYDGVMEGKVSDYHKLVSAIVNKWNFVLTDRYSVTHYYQDKRPKEETVSLSEPVLINKKEEQNILLGDVLHNDDWKNTDTQIMHSELSSQFHLALASLPQDERQVVILYYLSELSNQEVAKQLRVTIGTVSNYLEKATKKMGPLLANVALNRIAPDNVEAASLREPLVAAAVINEDLRKVDSLKRPLSPSEITESRFWKLLLKHGTKQNSDLTFYLALTPQNRERIATYLEALLNNGTSSENIQLKTAQSKLAQAAIYKRGREKYN